MRNVEAIRVSKWSPDGQIEGFRRAWMRNFHTSRWFFRFVRTWTFFLQPSRVINSQRFHGIVKSSIPKRGGCAARHGK